MKRLVSSFYKKTRKLLFYLEKKISLRESDSFIIQNVFKTDYNKTVLLSYIKSVFENSENIKDLRHTNRLTTFIIAEVFKETGYNVDVINYNEKYVGDFKKYNVIFGLGKTIEYNLAQRSGKTPFIIYFATGCNPLFSNVATLLRIGDFFKRNGKIILNSSRYISEDWPLQHEFADWIILHGNEFAKKTYRSDAITTINAPVFIKHDLSRSEENWNTARTSFVWFGSDGAIHKGLDLVIEAFQRMPDITLHICGNLTPESPFLDFYKNVFSTCANINFHGFVQVGSSQLNEIFLNSAFVIYPSASEGNSPSVITCMANGGLIPVVSDGADVLISDCGIRINSLDVNSVINSVNEATSLSLEEIKRRSKIVKNNSREVHSFEFFKADIRAKIQTVITDINN